MTDSKLSRIINSDLAIIIKIIGFISVVLAAYFGLGQQIALIQKDIETINNNHLMHIQDSLAKIEQRQDKQDLKIEELQKISTQLQVLINRYGTN